MVFVGHRTMHLSFEINTTSICLPEGMGECRVRGWVGVRGSVYGAELGEGVERVSVRWSV